MVYHQRLLWGVLVIWWVLFAGLAFGSYGLQLVELNVDGEGIRRLAELTLALVLFWALVLVLVLGEEGEGNTY